MGQCFATATPHPLRSAVVSPLPSPRGAVSPPSRRAPDPAVEALLAGGGLAMSSATQLTVGDGTLANALPTQDAPRRGILVAPPGELLGDEGELELTTGGRPATNLPLPGIEEGGAPDTQVSRASAQPTVHPGEAREGGDSPVLGVLVVAEATQPEGAVGTQGPASAAGTAAAATQEGEASATALGTVVASSSDGGLASGARATSSADGGLALGGSEDGLAHGGSGGSAEDGGGGGGGGGGGEVGSSPGAPEPAPAAPPP